MSASATLIIRKYFEVAKINYRSNTAYLIDILSIIWITAFRIWIFYHLFTFAFRTLGASDEEARITVWILALIQSFYLSNRSRMIIKNIIEDIKSGNVAYSIARPYSFIVFTVASNLGIILGYLIPTLLTAFVLGFWLLGPIEITLGNLAGGLILLTLGFILNCVMALAIACAAFWIEEASALRWWYDKIHMIFSGIFFPISLFPLWLKQIAQVLPFSQLFYNPAQMIVAGNLNFFGQALAGQIAWLVVLGLLAKIIYRAGIKKVSINGG